LEIVSKEQSKITLIRGDGVDLLDEVLASVPDTVVPCLFQTNIWRELSAEAKTRLLVCLEKTGRRRHLFFVSALKQLTLESFLPHGNQHWVLANFEAHGRWLEWLGK
jgi:hypothetical protein